MKSISELLTNRSPLTLKGSTSALEAARAMEKEHVGCLVVVDSAKKPLGVFTERDLMVRLVVGDLNPAEVQIQEVMTREPFVMDGTERLLKAAHEMQARHIRHLPVTESGKLVGVLSLRDLLRALLDEQRDETSEMRNYIQG
ncbi:MAG: CBS domain-containing protein [Planctomycetota bacterium]|jgi:CBS domain-containing protein